MFALSNEMLWFCSPFCSSCLIGCNRHISFWYISIRRASRNSRLITMAGWLLSGRSLNLAAEPSAAYYRITHHYILTDLIGFFTDWVFININSTHIINSFLAKDIGSAITVYEMFNWLSFSILSRKCSQYMRLRCLYVIHVWIRDMCVNYGINKPHSLRHY